MYVVGKPSFLSGRGQKKSSMRKRTEGRERRNERESEREREREQQRVVSAASGKAS